MLAGEEERARRGHQRLRESMADSAGQAQAMADVGLIEQAVADEHAELTRAVAARFAPEPATSSRDRAAVFAKDQLKAIVERIERLQEEKKAIADDIRDVYAEAKANGYDTKALREIIRLRKLDANERAERETILETYLQALGML